MVGPRTFRVIVAWMLILGFMPTILVTPSLGHDEDDLFLADAEGPAPYRVTNMAGHLAWEAQVDWPLITVGDTTLLVPPRSVGEKLAPTELDLVRLVEQEVFDPATGQLRVIIDTVPGHVLDMIPQARRIASTNLFSAHIGVQDLEGLAASHGVRHIHLDHRLRVLLDQSVHQIRADEVHRERDSLGRNVTGQGVTIAIIDTGVDAAHEDLGGCFGDGCKVVGGWDFYNDDADPMDDHGHGTHVAATAAGRYGVAPGANVVAYKVCGDGGYCWTSAILAAIEAAKDEADIVSMSLGGSGTSDHLLAQAVDDAVAGGLVVVSAAGNSGVEGSVGVPAAALRGIAVGATDGVHERAVFSSQGPVYDRNGTISGLKPDVMAPGVGIVAAVPTGDCVLCHPSGALPLSGTSMATPHVSGAAALMLQAHPLWAPETVKAALIGRASPLDGDVNAVGTGILDSYAAWNASYVMSPTTILFQPQIGENTHVSMNLTVKDLRPENDLTLPGLLPLASLLPATFGHQSVTMNLSSDAAARVEPTSISLPPGGQVNISVHVDQLDALDDGTYSVELAAGSKVSTHAVRGQIQRLQALTVDIAPGTYRLYVVRGSEVLDYRNYPDGQQTLFVEEGEYTLIAMGLDCSQPGPCRQAIGVEPSVNVTGPTHVEMDRLHEMISVDVTLARDGADDLDRGAVSSCTAEVSEAGCGWVRNDVYMRTNTSRWSGVDLTIVIRGAAVADAPFFSPLPSTWRTSHTVVYRDGLTTYVTGNETWGPQASMILGAPEQVSRYRIATPSLSAATDAHRWWTCWSKAPFGYHGFGSKQQLTADAPELLVIRAPWIGTDSGQPQAYAPACSRSEHAVNALTTPDLAPCDELEPDCTWRDIGKSMAQVPTTRGPVLVNGPFGGGLSIDPEAVLHNGTLNLWTGASAVAGTVSRWVDSLLIGMKGGWAPCDYSCGYVHGNTFFAPGSGGDRLMYQLHDNRQEYKVFRNNELVLSGAMDGPMELPVAMMDGDAIRIETTVSRSVVSGAGNATYVAEFMAGDLGDLPTVAGLRTYDEAGLATTFQHGESITVKVTIDRDGAVWPKRSTDLAAAGLIVKAADGNETSWEPTQDGTVWSTVLPTMSPGTYSLVFEAESLDGVSFGLTQSSAFTVEG